MNHAWVFKEEVGAYLKYVCTECKLESFGPKPTSTPAPPQWLVLPTTFCPGAP